MTEYKIGDLVDITFKGQMDLFDIRDKIGLIVNISTDPELSVPCYTVLVDEQIFSLYEHEFEPINTTTKPAS